MGVKGLEIITLMKITIIINIIIIHKSHRLTMRC